LKSERDILNSLVDKRNWMSEMQILRTAVKEYIKKEDKKNYKPHTHFCKLELIDKNGKQLNRFIKLKHIKEVFLHQSKILKMRR
jgi:hypothetical protein